MLSITHGKRFVNINRLLYETQHNCAQHCECDFRPTSMPMQQDTNMICNGMHREPQVVLCLIVGVAAPPSVLSGAVDERLNIGPAGHEASVVALPKIAGPLQPRAEVVDCRQRAELVGIHR